MADDLGYLIELDWIGLDCGAFAGATLAVAGVQCRTKAELWLWTFDLVALQEGLGSEKMVGML
jgi:hypothetical protein